MPRASRHPHPVGRDRCPCRLEPAPRRLISSVSPVHPAPVSARAGQQHRPSPLADGPPPGDIGAISTDIQIVAGRALTEARCLRPGKGRGPGVTTLTAPLDRLAAALADRYRLERELGAGGMARVYLA